MNNKLLPIGTVVLLAGGTKKVMITGYYSKAEDDDKVYTYNGCVFPEGFMENIFCLFDPFQIEEVCYLGLDNEEYEKYSADIKQRSFKLSGKVGLSAPVNSNNKDERKRGRTPKAPTNPLSVGEMRARYTQKKISGNQQESI